MATPLELQRQADEFRCAGRGDRAIPRYQEAIRLYTESDQLLDATECLHMLGVSLIFEDRYDEGKAALKQALEEREKQQRVVDVARVQRDMGIAEMVMRHYLLAVELLLKSRETLLVIDSHGERGITEAKLGRLYSLTGEFSSVDECFDEAYVLIGKADNLSYLVAAHIDNAIACLERGQFGHLDNHLTTAWRLLEESGQLQQQIRRKLQIYALQVRSAVNKAEWGVARSIYKQYYLNTADGVSQGNLASLDRELGVSELPSLLSLP